MRTYKDLALAEEEQKLEAAIEKSRNLLIEAPTGSGKSLYIPWFLSRNFCMGNSMQTGWCSMNTMSAGQTWICCLRI